MDTLKDFSSKETMTIDPDYAIIKEKLGNTGNKLKRIYEIDFTRACSCIGIIITHYFSHAIKPQIKFLYISANSGYGFMYVTVFFSISGIALFNKYSKKFSLIQFFFRRWKSIFPPFYISYFFFFVKTILNCKNKKFIFKCHPLHFIFTVLGIDGYFSYKFCVFYLIGEWFLGAIIMIYILYPILIWKINKLLYIIIIFISISCGYILIIFTKFFNIFFQRNLIVCITSFYFGIISLKYKKYFFENIYIGISSFLLLELLCFIKLFKNIIIFQIQGFSLFIFLIQVGKYIMNTKIKSFFIIISNHSFIIFLVHHQIIKEIQAVIPNEKWVTIIIAITIITLLSLIYSKVISLVLNSIFQTNLFKKIEKKFSYSNSKNIQLQQKEIFLIKEPGPPSWNNQ